MYLAYDCILPSITAMYLKVSHKQFQPLELMSNYTLARFLMILERNPWWYCCCVSIWLVGVLLYVASFRALVWVSWWSFLVGMLRLKWRTCDLVQSLALDGEILLREFASSVEPLLPNSQLAPQGESFSGVFMFSVHLESFCYCFLCYGNCNLLVVTVRLFEAPCLFIIGFCAVLTIHGPAVAYLNSLELRGHFPAITFGCE